MVNLVVNRKTIVSIVAVILLGFCVQGMSCSPPVDIPDSNLRRQIERALGKKSGAQITEANMATLTELNVPSYTSISNLTGLEFATNLTVLNLQGKSLSDISALSGLTNLTALNLGQNKVSDISALSGLTKLTALNLNFNKVSDISALSGLINLTSLNLNFSKVSDLSCLA
jgi:Leucine-rich repeat (LRR) protein